MFDVGLAYQTSWRRYSLFNATRRQFHQHYMREFFVQTLLWQLFSSYMYVVKAAKTMFVQKIRTFNVDEIDTRKGLFIPKSLKKTI